MLPLVIYQAFWHDPRNSVRNLGFWKVLMAGNLTIQENNRGLAHFPYWVVDLQLSPGRSLCLLLFLGISEGSTSSIFNWGLLSSSSPFLQQAVVLTGLVQYHISWKQGHLRLQNSKEGSNLIAP